MKKIINFPTKKISDSHEYYKNYVSIKNKLLNKINKNEYPEPKSLTKDECIKIINIPAEKSKGIIKEFDGGIQIRFGKYGKPPYILAVRGTEIGKLFQQKRNI